MNSTVFSAATLTEEEARRIAEAYIKGGKEPQKMAELLRVDRLDLNIIMHPYVRDHIARMQAALKPLHSLEDHVFQLAKIRDAAFEDENFKVALAAETQLGKAVGHYDPKGGDADPEGNQQPAKKLSTEDIRRELAKLSGAVVTPQGTLSLPGSIEAQEADEEDDNEI